MTQQFTYIKHFSETITANHLFRRQRIGFALRSRLYGAVAEASKDGDNPILEFTQRCKYTSVTRF